VAHYGAWTYFIPADAPNPEAAWIFLQWVNTSEVQKKIALEGGFPTLSSVFNDPELLEKLPYWQASLDAYEISSRRPRIPQWNEMNNAMMLELSHVIAGNKNSATALRDLESVYKKLLAGELPVDYQ
jgi:multiple sugar transport system substrate-binding protein